MKIMVEVCRSNQGRARCLVVGTEDGGRIVAGPSYSAITLVERFVVDSDELRRAIDEAEHSRKQAKGGAPC